MTTYTTLDGFRYEMIEGLGFGNSLYEVANLEYFLDGVRNHDDVSIEEYSRTSQIEQYDSNGADVLLVGPLYPNDSYEVLFRVEDEEYSRPQYLEDTLCGLANDVILNSESFLAREAQARADLANEIYNDICYSLTDEAQHLCDYNDWTYIQNNLLDIVEEHCEIEEYEGRLVALRYQEHRDEIIEDFDNFLCPLEEDVEEAA